ncbi:NAD-dependent epimerase/dehydratase family protein [Adhaeretor mobilis]|uniref:3 beta-hydroxysteroid dehydrogenase/Delta 5-->4-isomerase n=1 Tax=Adhaeretor mobilis TaxID=1930276 RepID=A0A517MS53_9BACT|nr:NAD-dependent epimerase/dehydratase family protein [Adhaeretor mobilis]QDS97713.1 3 beta-hydroxysteroid dehydrogenase/Delta 5-->4-isomerase [Adhaeretor mobilis]
MHALVTGGGGFLGRYIVEQLIERGDQVRSFGRGEYPELSEAGIEVVRGDIANEIAVADACAGIDCVFHVAALPGVSMRAKPYYDVNLSGTLNVVAACREHDVSRLVYTSSPSVVFAGEDQAGIDETAPLALDWLREHRSYYSHSKALAEEHVTNASGEHLRTCALRPHLIWGPRDGHLVPRLLDRARKGRLRRVGSGTNLVDMIYVENAAEAHLLAADALAQEDSPAAGKAYFLSQGEPVNCWGWIDEILGLAGLGPVERPISLPAAWRIGHVLESLYKTLQLSGEPPMTRFVAAQLAKSHWYDISAARRDLGYSPQVTTEEGMRRLGEWIQALETQ